MAYTFLRVTEAGVVLWEYHLRRMALEPGSRAHESFLEFGRTALPGAYAAWVEDGKLRIEQRPGSRLFDAIRARWLPSPIAGQTGAHPKDRQSASYASVRADKVATLLTSEDGSELYESCSAALLGWDHGLVCVPSDRPRVWSTAETAVREHLSPREAALSSRTLPLLLINAVKGTCSLAPEDVPAFPTEARATVDALFAKLTSRPA